MDVLTSVIAGAVLLLILGGAIAFIIKAKRSGKKCIGCPVSCSCGSANKESSCRGCNSACGKR